MQAIPTGNLGEHQLWWRTLLNQRPDYRPPRRFDRYTALRILQRDDIHPDDIHAMTYATRATAALAARANREAWGHPTLGVVNVEGIGWVSVIDLRPALAASGCPPIPPMR